MRRLSVLAAIISIRAVLYSGKCVCAVTSLSVWLIGIYEPSQSGSSSCRVGWSDFWEKWPVGKMCTIVLGPQFQNLTWSKASENVDCYPNLSNKSNFSHLGPKQIWISTFSFLRLFFEVKGRYLQNKYLFLRSLWFFENEIFNARGPRKCAAKLTIVSHYFSKNILDRQQCAWFRKSQKVIYHSTLL